MSHTAKLHRFKHKKRARYKRSPFKCSNFLLSNSKIISKRLLTPNFPLPAVFHLISGSTPDQLHLMSKNCSIMLNCYKALTIRLLKELA